VFRSLEQLIPQEGNLPGVFLPPHPRGPPTASKAWKNSRGGTTPRRREPLAPLSTPPGASLMN